MESTAIPPADETPPRLYDPWLKLLSSFSQEIWQRLRARSPQLVPLLICLGILPVLLLFSFIAGWFVWSSIPKGWYVPVYLQYGDGTAPYADLEITSLSTTQPYEISLQLTVPAIEANYEIGNFMASLSVTTYANESLAFIRRPAIILPPSSTILLRPPRLLHLTVPLASSLITGASRVNAHVELGRKDGWRTLGNAEGREISVHDARLHGVAHPQGLQRIVAAAPLSFAIAAAIVFFTVSTLILAGYLLPSVLQSEPESIQPTREAKSEEPTSSPEEPGTVTRLRRRSSRVKEESDTEESLFSPTIGSESTSEVRRRRRPRDDE